ncbi:unnamed protein product [Adineta ricciae]|uniref:Uncharacterized protein n=1 Tax=Adineta ricciae TaxID=249248 RepID=A0A814XRT9_ADIRI|nr:unnamed protein product [Adineta ricciae]CAF1227235.1 unnamed protein product [Adineta ricciae]
MFYTSIRSRMLTKDFDKPSFIDYKRLKQIYGDKFQCACSRVASTYDQFIKIAPTFHSAKSKAPALFSRLASSTHSSFHTNALASTLQCLYDQQCLNLIQHYTNYQKSIDPLSTENLSQFPNNVSIRERVNHVFIERWSTDTDYPSYYERCLPSVCTYSRIENFNMFYTINIIFDLQGGLSIVLKWISSKLVRIGLKIYHHRKKRATSIHPASSVEMSPNVTTDMIIPIMSHNKIDLFLN